MIDPTIETGKINWFFFTRNG